MNRQEVTIRVPAVPTRELSPNGRVHWRKKHRVAQELKQITMWAMNIENYGIITSTKYECPGELAGSRGAATKGLVSMQSNDTPSQLTSNAWSEEEDDFLRQHYLRCSHRELSALMDRTVNAVRHRCHRLGLRRAADHWTDEDICKLRRWYTERDGRPLELDALADSLGRLKSNVSRKAREMGLSNHRRTSVAKINGYYPNRIPKFSTDEERRAAQSHAMKKHIAENGHPRGMLGKTHTPETLEAIRVGHQKWLESATEEELYEIRRRGAMTRFKRYGTSGPRMPEGQNPYSRARGGKREDLDNRYFRSAWEANYARYLNWLLGNGEIQEWDYEPDTFVFHGETRGAIHYTPDFKVTEKNGDVIYHEVKGWMDGPSKTKLKRMKKHYPDIKVIVIGEDEYKSLAKWRGLIPEWE